MNSTGQPPGPPGAESPGPRSGASSPWWRSAVVYQIYPRSFADSDGDGVGDVRGILGKLDYLAGLGVDVIWLSPIYTSPQDDNGYDISDYEDIDPVFGTMADVEELIDGVHARGMRIVMDLVVNHTSDEHPWFVESRSSRDNPKRDWYWWRPARPGHEPGSAGAEPTNWTSFFSGPAWEYDPATDEYFLHIFTRKQPDLNWENPEVREAVYAMMRRWLERGVDGFRMDVINFLSKEVAPDGSLPDDSTDESTVYTVGGRFFLNGPRIHEFLNEMNREVLAGRDLITVGETPGVSVADARAYTDPARAEVDMVFTFAHVDLDQAPGGTKWDIIPLRLTDLKSTLSEWQEGLADVGWNSLYWNNHDQPRVVSRFGDDGAHRVASAKALGTVLHLMRGTPYIYQGEEFGMTNTPFASLGQYRDVESLNWAAQAADQGMPEDQILAKLAIKSRDNARTPVAWDAGPNAGFSTGTPWIGVNPNHVEINAEAAMADADSVFHHYRRLIELRHTLPVVVEGDYRPLMPDDEQVFAFVRSLEGDQLLVLANLSGESAEVDLGADSALLAGEVLLAGGAADTASLAGIEAVPAVLGPWESRVILSR
jgi:oligo-1,6-glucosidase